MTVVQTFPTANAAPLGPAILHPTDFSAERRRRPCARRRAGAEDPRAAVAAAYSRRRRRRADPQWPCPRRRPAGALGAAAARGALRRSATPPRLFRRLPRRAGAQRLRGRHRTFRQSSGRACGADDARPFGPELLVRRLAQPAGAAAGRCDDPVPARGPARPRRSANRRDPPRPRADPRRRPDSRRERHRARAGSARQARRPGRAAAAACRRRRARPIARGISR